MEVKAEKEIGGVSRGFSVVDWVAGRGPRPVACVSLLAAPASEVPRRREACLCGCHVGACGNITFLDQC